MVATIAAATGAAIFPATPAGAADMSKTLRTAYIAAETGFDPAASSDIYSDSVQRAIFDTLYGFDSLARPYRRTTRTAANPIRGSSASTAARSTTSTFRPTLATT